MATDHVACQEKTHFIYSGSTCHYGSYESCSQADHCITSHLIMIERLCLLVGMTSIMNLKSAWSISRTAHTITKDCFYPKGAFKPP